MTVLLHSATDRRHLGTMRPMSRLLPWTISPLDVAVYTVIVGIGVLEILLTQKSEFWFDDVAYLERALSLLRNHFYGVSGVPEHTQPPGFPILVALISMLFGSSHTVLLRAMAVFGTLSILATYELLRREESRSSAAAVCLLLGSSTHYFAMATRAIMPVYPYMLAAVGVLLAVRKADTAASRRTRTWWAVLAALLLAAALMIHSTGIALIGGLLAWIGVSFLADRRTAILRLKTFLPVLVVGLAVQGWWMHFATPTSEWPIPGYPASYVSQLKLKSGNFPELGMASAGDLVARAAHNLYDRARVLTELISHLSIPASWSSPAMATMFILVALGLGDSLRRSGGRLMDWYFLCLEGMYLLWPWPFEIRFHLPAAPFAALLAWRGVQTIHRLATRRPRVTGAAGILAISTALGIPPILWVLGWWSPRILPGGLQAIVSALVWLWIAIACAWMLWRGRPPFILVGECFAADRKRVRRLGAILVSMLVVLGIAQQVALGRENIYFMINDRTDPDVAGAKWLQVHTSPEVVVLARHVPIVYYYAQRRVHWFPPISKPAVLFEGIRQRNVSYVLVVKHEDPYYLPDDPDSFTPLLTAYPQAFRLAASGPSYSVYQVLR